MTVQDLNQGDWAFCWQQGNVGPITVIDHSGQAFLVEGSNGKFIAQEPELRMFGPYVAVDWRLRGWIR